MLAGGALSAALVLGAPAGMAGATSSHAKTIKVSTAKVPNVGVVLTTASGLTLYRFTQDASGTSSCTGVCAKIWPPLLASKGAHVSGPRGVKGLSVMNVGNGHFQVAFHKVALYRFSGDKKKGQAHGQSVLGKWFAVLKSGIPASATTGATGAAPSTSTTAPAPGTTQPTMQTTPTTPAQHSTTGGNSTTPTQTPGTQAPTPPPTSPPTSPPPTTTPPTQPPTTTTTAPVGGTGGAGF